jgi:hypothetical protein
VDVFTLEEGKMIARWVRCVSVQLLGMVLAVPVHGAANVGSANVNVEEIIRKSVVANQQNFEADPHYTYQETDHTGSSSKTYRVMMIDGSPYNRLIAEEGEPLSSQQSQAEERKLEQAKAQRRSESPRERQRRITKYQHGRQRDNEMMQQLTRAFTFKLVGERTLNGFEVYLLQATPKAGYKPPNMDTQVLPGMNGELWIDQKTYNWVKVTAKVIRRVSIEGFLAEVEPGTRFELEKRPVGDGIWMPSHFSMYSNAKVLYMFSHNSQQNQTFSDYQRTD